MTIQEVKDRWSPGMKDPQAAIDWWNSKAGAFASRDIPTAQSSLATVSYTHLTLPTIA